MKIDIPNPCPEKWNSMISTEEGAFCKVCNEHIFDLTKKTPQEIELFFLRKNPEEKTCGKLSARQILELNFENFFLRFRFWNIYRKIAVVVFFGFGLALFSCSGSTKDDDRVGKFVSPNDTLMFNDTMIKKSVLDSLQKNKPS